METPVAPERVLEAARDFSERRAEMWPDVHVEHLQVHEAGETFAEVTEGNPWPIGYVWERLRYDWSEPDRSRAWSPTRTSSSPGAPGRSGLRRQMAAARWRYSEFATSGAARAGCSPPVFPLGLAKRTVADHLRHFLSKIEEQESGSR
jgi:hypothetical protein